MTAQETENQAIEAVPSVEATVGNETASADLAAAEESSASTDTPAEDAGSTASSSEPSDDAGTPAETVPTGEPQPDAVSPRDKLHEDTLKLIIACRLQGVDIIEFVTAKLEEIKD